MGDKVKVKVLEVDRDRERISLSIRQTLENPWDTFTRDNQVGDIVEGVVTKTVPFGAFVSIAEGVEGLVHVSEIAIHRVESPELELSIGQVVKAKITEKEDERRRICQRYMGLMGLADFADAYPKTLSGGMRQRLAIARAYAVRPEFLLMDEPFGALDAQTRSNMQNLLLEVLQQEGKTVMLITHSVEEAIYLSSRIVVVTARPARIRRIIDVPFAYPRSESLHETPEFGALRSEVRELVMREYAAQQQQGRRQAAAE